MISMEAARAKVTAGVLTVALLTGVAVSTHGTYGHFLAHWVQLNEVRTQNDAHSGIPNHACCPQLHPEFLPMVQTRMPPATLPCPNEHSCCIGSQENQFANLPVTQSTNRPQADASLWTWTTIRLFAGPAACPACAEHLSLTGSTFSTVLRI
jgi:hypothetical protein